MYYVFMRGHGEERLVDTVRFCIWMQIRPSRFVWDHFDIALRKEPCFLFISFFVFLPQPAVSNQTIEHAGAEDALVILSCRFLKRF